MCATAESISCFYALNPSALLFIVQTQLFIWYLLFTNINYVKMGEGRVHVCSGELFSGETFHHGRL